MHADRLWDYGYIGRFDTYRSPTFAFDSPSNRFVQVGERDTLVTFSPGTANPELAAFDNYYFNNAPLEQFPLELPKRNTLFLIGVNMGAATCGPRGSPFQMPTRLADGLGLESGLETGCPVSYAPSLNPYPRTLGPPHRPAGRQTGLGCNYCQNQSHQERICQAKELVKICIQLRCLRL